METHEEAAGRRVGEQLATAFNDLVDRALDPEASAIDRAAMVTGLLKAVESRQKELAQARRADLDAVRPSMTLAAIGEAVGLSTGRVDQIIKRR
jgi:DNA-directed RNA polymerase sigma subunit (sigma70/sigma32)